MSSETANSSTNSPSNGIEIDIGEFLNLLKLAFYLDDEVSNDGKRNGIEIDYNQLINNELFNKILEQQQQQQNVKENDNTETNACSSSNNASSINKIRQQKSLPKQQKTIDYSQIKRKMYPVLSEKIEEIINEGVFESLLPYICPSMACSSLNLSTNNTNSNNNPNQLKIKKSKTGDINSNNLKLPALPSNYDLDKKDTTIHEGFSNTAISKSPRYNDAHHHSSRTTKDSMKNSRRKSLVNSSQAQVDDKRGEIDVVIHVCDEIKNISKDFTCSQNLLITKMGYFADVTAGQKLEDMDISVHCDIQIFEWLMKWVKKDQNQSDGSPQLDAMNVVPILVSASFLQMEPLLLDCLTFCHSRLNEVVRCSMNLSCLNDSIITRLAAMFTNSELEMVKDKKERVTPRLWIKMIISLCEPEPQALRGHYFSLAGLFRCNKCGKYLTQSVSSYITCVPSNVRLNRWGQLISKHSRDTSWQITNYVGVIFKELKSWRKVYWKLWGHCHFLYCCICEMHFPIYQMNWCQYHPENPQFLGPISEGKMPGPAGRYPCCGQQAFRYESLPGPNGCQYREHSVLVETDRDRAILILAQNVAENDCLYDPAPSKLPANTNYEPSWTGISLMPTKCRQGILPQLTVEDHHSKVSRRMRQAAARIMDSSSETSDTSGDIDDKLKNWKNSTSSDGCESESSSSPSPFIRKKRIVRQVKITGGRYWSGEVSARSNQDNQRDFEEKIMKKVVQMVNKKLGNDTKISNQNYPTGGSYVRLEAEWKDQLKQKNLNKPKTNK